MKMNNVLFGENIEAVTLIDALPQQIWQVLTDTDLYAQWNPVIVRLSGELRPGNVIEFDNQQPNGKVMTFRPTILDAASPTELRWLGHLWRPGLFDGEHYFLLEPLPNGKTRLRHGEHFQGLLVPLVRRWLRRQIWPNYAQINDALKRRVEHVAYQPA